MNSSVAGTARAGSCASPISPTMIPRYAGTNGMMQGARNDATPAPNNAITCVTVLLIVPPCLSDRPDSPASPEGKRVRLESGLFRDHVQLVVLDSRSLDQSIHVGPRDRDHGPAVP